MSTGHAPGAGADPPRSWNPDDDAAFEALFRHHYAGLCAFANGIVKAPDIAEEIVQDVFMNLWRTRGRVAVRSSVRAYLFGAVRNRSLNARRRPADIPLQSVADSSLEIGEPIDPVADIEATERATRVSRAVERLPSRCREVIRLRWGHRLSHQEIADSLGISRKAVEASITRGLRALRELLSGSTG